MDEIQEGMQREKKYIDELVRKVLAPYLERQLGVKVIVEQVMWGLKYILALNTGFFKPKVVLLDRKSSGPPRYVDDSVFIIYKGPMEKFRVDVNKIVHDLTLVAEEHRNSMGARNLKVLLK